MLFGMDKRSFFFRLSASSLEGTSWGVLKNDTFLKIIYKGNVINHFCNALREIPPNELELSQRKINFHIHFVGFFEAKQLLDLHYQRKKIILGKKAKKKFLVTSTPSNICIFHHIAMALSQ